MRFSFSYPLVAHPQNPAFLTGAGMARLCQAAESAGFDAVGFTDHPAPTDRWLNAGGHDALDPFVAFAYCAAATERLLLIPNILVLPYRNPFLVAKAVATLDALSGGRFVLAVAPGYLRGEYKALGVDFEERNDLFDEAIEVIRGVWSTDDYTFVGRHFEAFGQSANPKPASSPPLWIGGNSRLARRRVAQYGDGWAPFFAPRKLAATAKTTSLETLADLVGMLDVLWQFTDEAGRNPAMIDVAFSSGAGGDPATEDFSGEARLEALAELTRVGVTWSGVSVPDDSIEHAIETLERFGTTVIEPLRGG